MLGKEVFWDVRTAAVQLFLDTIRLPSERPCGYHKTPVAARMLSSWQGRVHGAGLGTRVIWGSPGAEPCPWLVPHTPGSSQSGQRRALVRRLTLSRGLLPPFFSKILVWASPLRVAKYSCVYLYNSMAKERPRLFSLAEGVLKAVFCCPSFSPAMGILYCVLLAS